MTKNVIPQQFLPPIAKPTVDSTLDRFKMEIFKELNCHKVGVIQSFDAAKQTASVQLVDFINLFTINGALTLPYSLLIHCPIIIMKNKGGGLTSPVRVGDECLVFFNDTNLDNWQVNGGQQQQATQRAHNITDAIAIVGLHSYVNSVAEYNNAATELDFISTGGVRQGKISLDAKVGISNATQDLKTLIDSLLITLKNLKTVNGVAEYPIDATTSAALDVAITNFDALLK